MQDTKVARLQKGITSATVETLLEGDRVLRAAHASPDTLVIVRPLPMQEVCFVSFGDASFASAKQLSDQQSGEINPSLLSLCSMSSSLHETRQQSFRTSRLATSKQIGRLGD